MLISGINTYNPNLKKFAKTRSESIYLLEVKIEKYFEYMNSNKIRDY